jgi:hypothetical protein
MLARDYGASGGKVNTKIIKCDDTETPHLPHVVTALSLRCTLSV